MQHDKKTTAKHYQILSRRTYDIHGVAAEEPADEKQPETEQDGNTAQVEGEANADSAVDQSTKSRSKKNS